MATEIDRSAPLPAPLDSFFEAVLVTRLDRRGGRIVVLGLAGLVALVAVHQGIAAAIFSAILLALLVGVIVVAFERDRWAAQDVIVRFHAQRRVEWLRDTGTEATHGSAAEAEVWLGAHQPGSVPQRYRAIIAEETRDPFVIGRERAALPDATLLDRANREQLDRSREWRSGADPDTTGLRGLIADLPDTVDRRMLETWLLQVEAASGFRRGERDWMRPLLAARTVVPRGGEPFRWRLGVWVSRFAPVIAVLTTSLVVSAIALSVPVHADDVPAKYADTELAARGEVPKFDVDRVWRTLPEVERALPAAEPLEPTSLSNSEADDLLFYGTPTVIWTVGRIDVTAPAALAGHRIWEIEVLLGPSYVRDNLGIITIDRSNGPRFLYQLDASVVADLRAAAGLPEPSPTL